MSSPSSKEISDLQPSFNTAYQSSTSLKKLADNTSPTFSDQFFNFAPNNEDLASSTAGSMSNLLDSENVC